MYKLNEQNLQYIKQHYNNVGVVYLLEFNGKFYVGSTRNLKRRISEYSNEARLRRELIKGESKIHRAILKHGIHNFTLTILVRDLVTKEELINAESRAMLKYQPTYNLLKVAYSSLGHKLSPETKQKMSAAKLGIVSNSKGIGRTDVSRELIKINNAKSVKVACFTRDGKLYEHFGSFSDASKVTGISRFRIARNLGK